MLSIMSPFRPPGRTDIFSLFYISIFYAAGQSGYVLFYELFTNRREFLFARYLVRYELSVIKQRKCGVGAGRVLSLIAR